MRHGCSSKIASWIDTLMIQDLSARKMRRLRDHLSSCPHCQQRYNRSVMASRLLDGGPEALSVPSERELRWAGQEVLERTRLVPDSAPPRRALIGWIAGLAATAAALAIVIPLAIGPRSPTEGRLPPGAAREIGAMEFQVRSDLPSKAAAHKLGFRAFCIQPRAEGAPQVTGLVPASVQAPPSTCRLGDILRFAYTNRSRLGYLFLVGVDERYGIKWYEPHPPQQRSIEVELDVVDKPLSRAVHLKVNHKQGLVRIFALFSAVPLDAAQVQRSVARARSDKRPLEQLQQLPIADTLQHSLLVRVEP